MRKKMLIMLLIPFCMLPACSVDDANFQDTDINITTISTAESSSSPKSNYLAQNTDGLDLFYDYDSVISLCTDASNEFVKAVKDNSNIDFSQYIDNAILQSYMKYKVENHIYSYSANDKSRLFITKVDFHDDYALVEGSLATYLGDSICMEGKSYFLIKNHKGKYTIVEWYQDNMDSLDVKFRGEFTIENNLDFWENSNKYSIVKEKLQLN